MRWLPLLAADFSFVLAAQERPDFTGTWKLSIDESDFAGRPAPQARTDVIEQTGPTLHESVKEVVGGRIRAGMLRYELDGATTQNVFDGESMQTTAKWDGSDLLIHSVTHGAGGDVSIDDRWVMSLDKRKLTIRRHIEGRGHQWDQSLIEYFAQ